MEFLSRKVMITGSEKEAKLNIEGKETVENFEVFENVAVLNLFEKMSIDFGVFFLIVRWSIFVGFKSEKCVVVGKFSFVYQKGLYTFLVVYFSLAVMSLI